QPSQVQQLVNEQAEDETLWCKSHTIVESILQSALRRLHAAIEAMPAQPPLPVQGNNAANNESEDIVKTTLGMARQAGNGELFGAMQLAFLERFEALVRADERAAPTVQDEVCNKRADVYATPPARPAVPDFKSFKEWAASEGYDVAYTHDGIKWVCLNPITADLWRAWQAAHGIGAKPATQGGNE
ncbi:MAG: hypothetical protein ACK5A0_14865, partial [Polaromonas sp.]